MIRRGLLLAIPIVGGLSTTALATSVMFPTLFSVTEKQRLDCVTILTVHADGAPFVTPVDPQQCSRDPKPTNPRIHYFVARHGAGAMPELYGFEFSARTAPGEQLIPAGDWSARSRANIPDSFEMNQETGQEVTVRWGGFGGWGRSTVS